MKPAGMLALESGERAFQFHKEKATWTLHFLCTWLPPPIRPAVGGTGAGAGRRTVKLMRFMSPSGPQKQEAERPAAGAVTSSLGHPVLALEKCSLHRPGEAETHAGDRSYLTAWLTPECNELELESFTQEHE